jgi:hypothetical protein
MVVFGGSRPVTPPAPAAGAGQAATGQRERQPDGGCLSDLLAFDPRSLFSDVNIEVEVEVEVYASGFHQSNRIRRRGGWSRPRGSDLHKKPSGRTEIRFFSESAHSSGMCSYSILSPSYSINIDLR